MRLKFEPVKSCIPLVLFFLSYGVGLFLILTHEHFSGATFVSYSVASAILCLVLYLAPKLKEFTVLGNTVKLLEGTQKEAEKVSNEIKELKIQTEITAYRRQLAVIDAIDINFLGEQAEPEKFISLCDAIIKSGYESELKRDILTKGERIVSSFYRRFEKAGFPLTDFLGSGIIEPERISFRLKNDGKVPEDEIIEDLKNYSEIYRIYQHVSKK